MVAALAAVACTMSLAACGQDEPGKIRIGIKFDQPGLGFKKSGTYVGFDVDVAKIGRASCRERVCLYV